MLVGVVFCGVLLWVILIFGFFGVWLGLIFFMGLRMAVGYVRYIFFVIFMRFFFFNLKRRKKKEIKGEYENKKKKEKKRFGRDFYLFDFGFFVILFDMFYLFRILLKNGLWWFLYREFV